MLTSYRNEISRTQEVAVFGIDNPDLVHGDSMAEIHVVGSFRLAVLISRPACRLPQNLVSLTPPCHPNTL